MVGRWTTLSTDQPGRPCNIMPSRDLTWTLTMAPGGLFSSTNHWFSGSLLASLGYIILRIVQSDSVLRVWVTSKATSPTAGGSPPVASRCCG